MTVHRYVTRQLTPSIQNGTTTSLSPFLIAESNFAPVITRVVLPLDPVPVGSSTTARAEYSDVNPLDLHTGGFDWEGSTSIASTVVEPSGAMPGFISVARTYAQAGVYTVVASVSDGEFGASRSSVLDPQAYVVVYDPAAGFVTGSGWILSPAAACLSTLCGTAGTAVGKATFGFVAKYLKKHEKPTGTTAFEFKTGALRFASTSYEWLVVAGSKAQFKGEGSVNGVAGYQFLLTAIDGNLNGARDGDQFRIKITGPGGVVYDNQRNADGSSKSDDSDAATILGEGSIVIHKN